MLSLGRSSGWLLGCGNEECGTPINFLSFISVLNGLPLAWFNPSVLRIRLKKHPRLGRELVTYIMPFLVGIEVNLTVLNYKVWMHKVSAMQVFDIHC